MALIDEQHETIENILEPFFRTLSESIDLLQNTLQGLNSIKYSALTTSQNMHTLLLLSNESKEKLTKIVINGNE
jgi:hypothetical protein